MASAQDGTLQIIAHNEAFKRALEGKESDKKDSAAASSDNAYAEQRYDGVSKYTAYRTEVARAKGLAAPDNYEIHTTVRDANEKFAFNFPDADGKLVSNDDPRFKGHEFTVKIEELLAQKGSVAVADATSAAHPVASR